MSTRNIIIIAVIALIATNFLTYTLAKKESTTPRVELNKTPHPATGMAQVAKAKKQETKAKPAQSAKSFTGPKPGEPIKAGDLNWLHIEDAGKLANKEGKKFLVDVYTDWCGWCKVMDKQTFSDPEIQAFINEHFHVVKFNAEQRDPIQFNGETFNLVKSGRNGVNGLAIKLLGKRLSYPTIVYLDENLNQIKSTRGFKKPEQLMETLKLIAG